MPRILGVDIPDKKRVDVSLRYIYGIGRTSAEDICRISQIDPSSRASELTESDISAITKALQDSYTVEGDLRRQQQQNIRRLIAVNCYRGQRHRRGLPVRGQRSRTNARTRKGGKRTVGAIRDRSARRQARTGE